MAQDFPVIAETIIVEGRDDTNSIKRAVAAETIETHGFGIRRETWELIDKAYWTTGIIVFTDPDHAGETIRKRILGVLWLSTSAAANSISSSCLAFICRRTSARGFMLLK